MVQCYGFGFTSDPCPCDDEPVVGSAKEETAGPRAPRFSQ